MSVTSLLTMYFIGFPEKNLPIRYPLVVVTELFNFVWLCLGTGCTWFKLGKDYGFELIQNKNQQLPET